MRVVHKSYEFRIYPTKEQEPLLSKHFGCSRFVYNYFLNECKEQHQKYKKSDNYYTQQGSNSILLKNKDKKYEKINYLVSKDF